MYRVSIGLVVLISLTGCRPKETSILSDELVSEKCRSIVENFECWFGGDTMKWIEETPWEQVSTRHKDMVVETIAKCLSHYSGDFMRVFALGYMDPAYSFPRIAMFKTSRYPLARAHVAEAIPLEGEYKERALRLLVELLFDSEGTVSTSVACIISRRLDKADSLPLLLLHYFENVHGKVTKAGRSTAKATTDWVRVLAASQYRGVLVPWLEEIKEQTGRDPVRAWAAYGPPSKWASWWDQARAEHSTALLEGRRIARQMKRKYGPFI